MKNFYIKNVKKTRIKPVDSETASLTGTPRKIKDELTIKKYSKNLFYTLFVIFIITFLCLLLFKIKLNYINKNNYQNSNEIHSPNNELDIHKISSMNDINYIRSFEISNMNVTDIQKYFQYMDNAKNDIYMNKQNLVRVENPKVTIIISIYNRKNYVNSTIRSIQNQNLKELEILYIDDFS